MSKEASSQQDDTGGSMKLARLLGTLLVLASAIFITRPASAQEAEGRWAVAGSVDGKAFTLDCRFRTTDADLSGACIDGPTGDATVQGGRSHALMEGRISGEKISWTYQTSYLFIKFDVKYEGILLGNHITGSIAAAGKTGTFTADRVLP